MNHEIILQQTKQKNPSHNHQHYRNRLSCPVCCFKRLIDTSQYIRSKTYTAGEEGYLNADYYQKCSVCKADIGIQKT